MARLLIGILAGLVIGILAALYMTGGFSRAAGPPGVPIAPPDPNGVMPGTVEVVLREQLFNEVLGTIFREISNPQFALSEGEQPAECPSAITILPEHGGVRTGVVFENGRVGTRLAFTGTYRSMFGCFNFSGWSPASLDLRYDPASRSVLGQATVSSVNLEGVNPALSVLITPFVQSTINSRVNPITIIRGDQLQFENPVAAANGNLRGNVQDVRAEVREDALRLLVIYDFAGGTGGSQHSAF